MAGRKTGASAIKPATNAPTRNATRSVKVRVREGETGYFDHIRRREGDVFVLPVVMVNDKGEALDAKTYPYGRLFSERWMDVVSEATPESVTTGKVALQNYHDEVVGTRLGGARAADTAVLEG